MRDYINRLKKYLADNSIQKKVQIPAGVKIISFTFDDAHKSAFTTAKSILNKHNLKATFYLSLSLLESINESNNFYNREDLIACNLQGHELGGHTFRHVHFWDISDLNTIKLEIEKNYKTINEVGINVRFRNFSYPFGEQTRKAKMVVSKYFETCRGIDHGVNIGKTDVFNLKAVRLYEKYHSLDKIYSILEDFSNSGGWLIFYTHDVKTDFSDYGCSPEYFENVVSRCLELNFDIKSVKDAFSNLQAT